MYIPQAVQVVVQSHDGTKTKTRSNPKGTDWVSATWGASCLSTTTVFTLVYLQLLHFCNGMYVQNFCLKNIRGEMGNSIIVL